jgi:hypothetical protein
MAHAIPKFKVVKVRLDPENGEYPLHGSVSHETAPDAHAEAKRSAESYPQSAFNPADNTWLVKGRDGRRIRSM